MACYRKDKWAPADAVVRHSSLAVRPSARLDSGVVPVLAAGRLLAQEGGAHHQPHRRGGHEPGPRAASST